MAGEGEGVDYSSAPTVGPVDELTNEPTDELNIDRERNGTRPAKATASEGHCEEMAFRTATYSSNAGTLRPSTDAMLMIRAAELGEASRASSPANACGAVADVAEV